MDQLYTTSQVSNITRLNKKVQKQKIKNIYNYTYFTVRLALYSKIITIIVNFVEHKN